VQVHRLVVFLVWCVFLINPLIAFASNYGDGINAMQNGNHEEAVKLFQVAAENGDKFSQHCLGVILYKGLGVKQNYTEAFKWLNLSAKQGFSQAILDLAIMKYHIKGTPNNYIDEYN
jgi:TPR repeat protein